MCVGGGESGELTAQMLSQRDLSSSDEEQIHREQLQGLLMGVLIRMARRVYWCYMRQLWDSGEATVNDNPKSKYAVNDNQDIQVPEMPDIDGRTYHQRCIYEDLLREEIYVEIIRLVKNLGVKKALIRSFMMLMFT